MPFIGQTRSFGGVEHTYTEDGWVPVRSSEPLGPPEELAVTTIGEVPPLNPDDYWFKQDEYGNWVPAEPSEPGARFDEGKWADAQEWRLDAERGFAPTGTGRTGPTAAELAIERSKVQAQNLATFIQGTVSELQLEIDAGRLKTDQALQEFNRKLDAFSEASKRFEGIQPYTIPIGAEYAPGFQPGGIGEQLGIAPRPAEVIQYDPFAMANEIVSGTPVITDIGVPTGDALAEAIEIARGFMGG